MKVFIFYLVLFYLIIQVNLNLTSEKRQELLDKLTKKVNLKNEKLLNLKSGQLKYIPTYHYTPEEIKEKILDKYDFPLDYNFFNATNCTKRIKAQGKCGSCWSFTSTSSLAYRYCQTYGMDIDLSPQDGVSCYIKSCEIGNYLIDSVLHLIKNGTLTDSCFPYTSGEDGSIEECPTKCKSENDEFKRYYAQNAYLTEDYLNQNTFLEIVTLIIDQLITFGPVVSGFDVYRDFYNLRYNKSLCPSDFIYSYDRKSDYMGGHAVVIVGYGFLNDKFYWTVQNSWGETFCDDGFIKIEFGQVGIEQITFAEPYIHKDIDIEDKRNISVSYFDIDKECFLFVNTTSNISDWVNSLDIRFRNEENSKDFNYQCSKINIKGKGDVIKCYYDFWNYFSYRGIYTFQDSKSLGDENLFILDEEFKQKKFDFFGYNSIYTEISEYYFISGEGSRILMAFSPSRTNEEIKLTNIYANSENDKPLKNCHIIEGHPYMYCDITKEELDYFEYYTKKNETDKDIVYDVLCGYKSHTDAVVYRLDKDKFPVFKIKDFQLEKVEEISNVTEFNLIADVEGNYELYTEGTNTFINSINIEIKGETETKNETYTLYCYVDSNSKKENNFILKCNDLKIENSTKYENVYLLPYYLPLDYTYPSELYIQNEIKATIIEKNPSPKKESKSNTKKILIITFSIIGGIIIIALIVFLMIKFLGKKTNINDIEQDTSNNQLLESNEMK